MTATATVHDMARRLADQATPPEGLTLSVLAGRDHNNQPVVYILAVGPRQISCARCGETLPTVDRLPASLNRDQLESTGQRCCELGGTCDEWCGPAWAALRIDSDTTEADVTAFLTDARSEVARVRGKKRAALAASLRDDLDAALERVVVDAVDPTDIVTGSDAEPGVWQTTTGAWEAWAYDVYGDIVTVPA